MNDEIKKGLQLIDEFEIDDDVVETREAIKQLYVLGLIELRVESAIDKITGEHCVRLAYRGIAPEDPTADGA